MRIVKVLCCLTFLFAGGTSVLARAAGSGDILPAGPFTPGFRLIETSDATRSFPSDDGRGSGPRPMRIYVWYPAAPTSERADAARRLRPYGPR
ncbi:MAG: hypothetical protein M0C28_32430 [Candidatus Moduliflexus flocculans]|nr:hypothetical protein [Candidatus Moduliflexus flocculans]